MSTTVSGCLVRDAARSPRVFPWVNQAMRDEDRRLHPTPRKEHGGQSVPHVHIQNRLKVSNSTRLHKTRILVLGILRAF
jgi:hypothetical protein